MKKIILSLLFLLSFSWCYACDTEKILRFDVLTQISADSSVTVRERIIVCSTSKEIKRGIYRTLAKKGLDRYEILSVSRDGQKEKFFKTNDLKTLTLKIGDPRKKISKGVHTYDIHYRVFGALRYHNNFDEFYWNLTGNDWKFEIEKAAVHVALPKGASLVKNGVSLYAGRSGAKGSERTAQSVENLFFYTTTPLAPGEGFTISLAWNKGAVTEPSWLEKNFRWPPSLFMWWLFLLVYYVGVWYCIGRDPKSKVIRQFAPPEGLSPAQMMYLVKMGIVANQSILPVILFSLQAKKKILINKTTAHRLPASGEEQALSPEEKIILEGMFPGGKTILEADKNNKVSLISLAHNSYSSLRKWSKPFFSTNFWYNLPTFIFVFALGMHFLYDDAALTLFGFAVGIALCKSRNVILNLSFVGMMYFFYYMSPVEIEPMVPLKIILYMIPGFLFSRWIPSYSSKGRALMDKIEGFAEYMRVAEKHRVFASDPSRAGFMFCQYFPYAMALGLENKWKDALVEQLGQAAAEKSVAMAGENLSFITHFHSMCSSFSSKIDSSSSSGFDGGGCSGGGSGGGGGGGW